MCIAATLAAFAHGRVGTEGQVPAASNLDSVQPPPYNSENYINFKIIRYNSENSTITKLCKSAYQKITIFRQHLYRKFYRICIDNCENYEAPKPVMSLLNRRSLQKQITKFHNRATTMKYVFIRAR